MTMSLTGSLASPCALMLLVETCTSGWGRCFVTIDYLQGRKTWLELACSRLVAGVLRCPVDLRVWRVAR